LAWYSLAFASLAAMASCAEDPPPPPGGGASSGDARVIDRHDLEDAGFRGAIFVVLSRGRGRDASPAVGDASEQTTWSMTCLRGWPARRCAFDTPRAGLNRAATSGGEGVCQLFANLDDGKELATSRFLSVITAPRDTVSDHPSFVTLTRRGLPVHMHPAPPEDILPSRQGKKNPLVLVGAAVTAGVLTVGFVAFKAGNANLSQTMMKARVFAQGATVALMVGTSGAAVLPSFTGSK
jgi:hypothetical protein